MLKDSEQGRGVEAGSAPRSTVGSSSRITWDPIVNHGGDSTAMVICLKGFHKRKYRTHSIHSVSTEPNKIKDEMQPDRRVQSSVSRGLYWAPNPKHSHPFGSRNESHRFTVIAIK